VVRTGGQRRAIINDRARPPHTKTLDGNWSKVVVFADSEISFLARVHRAQQHAGKGHSGKTYSKSINGRKGKVPMVKKVRRKSGVVFNTALVVIGWLSTNFHKYGYV